ncbi:laccase-4 isoform X1 [Neodiprion lecontei]|uniref:Laccase-4 isoform X1 n=1 Tax=Neodiprion lecontei TaxID=441921 RepID=A0A6J0CCP7_NEOLC|nr:laccase-4 isoform X1 [Neodiprion lecontei]
MGLSKGNDYIMISNVLYRFALFATPLLIMSSFADANHVLDRCDSEKHEVLSTPHECARPCIDGEKPKTCYYQFYLESYVTMGQACEYCLPNITNQLNATCQCVTADGVERAVLTVNRMIPGPSIQVCKGDYVVIDAVNLMSGQAMSIHWHGILQDGSQYYDGVPFVTQCPIADGNSFRYQWLAGNEGTHFWHAHHGSQRIDGLYGSIIVRTEKSFHRNMYDYDRPQDVIMLSDWFHVSASEHWPGTQVVNMGQNPDSLLIEGLGQYTDPATGNTTTTPLAVYKVKPGKRYRMRCIVATSMHCPYEFSIEGHRLLLIATDGVNIEPTWVDSIMSTGGERYDFVLFPKKNYSQKSYWIRLRTLDPCAGIQQFAVLQHKGGPDLPSSPRPVYNESFVTNGVVANAMNVNCSDNNRTELCVSDFRTTISYDNNIGDEPDFKHAVAFNFTAWLPADLYKPNSYGRFLMVAKDVPLSANLGQLSYVGPPSPVLSQFEDVPPDVFCNETHRPVPVGGVSMCTNMMNIPLGALCEFIVYDPSATTGLNHPMHLHGYHFHVVGMGLNPGKYPVLNNTVIHIYDKQNLLPRNFINPVLKDTVTIPSRGYVIIRFPANNPGFWLFHCHFDFHMITGMQMILHVGEQKDLPPVPPGFPKCSDYKPPIESVYEMKYL